MTSPSTTDEPATTVTTAPATTASPPHLGPDDRDPGSTTSVTSAPTTRRPAPSPVRSSCRRTRAAGPVEIVVRWNAVPGATGYRVVVRNSSAVVHRGGRVRRHHRGHDGRARRGETSGRPGIPTCPTAVPWALDSSPWFEYVEASGARQACFRVAATNAAGAGSYFGGSAACRLRRRCSCAPPGGGRWSGPQPSRARSACLAMLISLVINSRTLRSVPITNVARLFGRSGSGPVAERAGHLPVHVREERVVEGVLLGEVVLLLDRVGADADPLGTDRLELRRQVAEVAASGAAGCERGRVEEQHDWPLFPGTRPASAPRRPGRATRSRLPASPVRMAHPQVDHVALSSASTSSGPQGRRSLGRPVACASACQPPVMMDDGAAHSGGADSLLIAGAYRGHRHGRAGPARLLDPAVSRLDWAFAPTAAAAVAGIAAVWRRAPRGEVATVVRPIIGLPPRPAVHRRPGDLVVPALDAGAAPPPGRPLHRPLRAVCVRLAELTKRWRVGVAGFIVVEPRGRHPRPAARLDAAACERLACGPLAWSPRHRPRWTVPPQSEPHGSFVAPPGGAGPLSARIGTSPRGRGSARSGEPSPIGSPAGSRGAGEAGSGWRVAAGDTPYASS